MVKEGINGRAWQIAFWVMAAIATVAIPFLATNVIANDRRNTDEHTQIRQEQVDNNKEQAQNFQKMFIEMGKMTERLARIEAKI